MTLHSCFQPASLTPHPAPLQSLWSFCPFTAMQSLLGDVSLFFSFLVSQAFTTMLAKRGTVFEHECIGYHFDGLLSQLLVALHPLILFIAMWQWLWLSRGDVTECIVYVSGHDPLSFLSCHFSFWLDGSFMAQLSKVLKLVRWAGSVPFPPESLQ